MDFDEYEYLEKTSENPEPLKTKEDANGGEEIVKSAEKERRRSSRHRVDDNDEDVDHRSKRSKSGEDDRHREKGLSRRRSRSRDGERIEKDRHRSNREHREKDREERNGRGRDRDREHDGGRSRRERESDREGEREKEKDREIEPERRRSRSHSERRQSERDEKDRERSRDRHIKEKEREMEKEKEREMEKEIRDRESRRHKEKKEEAEPEVDPERDQRTVFAYQICLKADERDVYEFFSRAGKVRDVRLIMDRNSRRSKGVGYIEFYDVMSVPMAIALSGQPLLGQPVMVKPSEAEKNLVQSTAAAAGPAGGIGSYSGGARRLYVGNLHFNITEDQLRQVFESFGIVELVQLPRDETGNCKGFGFVQFARLEDAKAAQSLNGQLEIAGRLIKVSAITDQVGMLDTGVNAGDFDDDEGGGLALNARSRAILMQKLDRSGTTSSLTGATNVNTPGLTLPMAPFLGTTPGISPLVQPTIPAIAGFPGAGLQIPAVTAAPFIDTIGVPSECLMLKNMFDPTTETEPDFDMDIKEDVEDECSKFGKVKHIYVDKNSAGHVYLRFDNTEAAMGAQRALHGRWFAGKMITATFILPQNYEVQFPDC